MELLHKLNTNNEVEMVSKFWSDCHGGIITTELVLVSSVVVAGVLTGLTALRSSVNAEFQELGHTVRHFDEVQTAIEPYHEVTAEVPNIYLPEEFIATH